MFDRPYKLLNSAVMPRPGRYTAHVLSEREFVDLLRQGFTSYVGYPATAEHIRRIAGVDVPLSREPVELRNGDRMLVCRLRYRLQDPGQKAQNFTPAPEDFEYLRVDYEEFAP